MPQESSPIQFYKLKNTKAADMLSTIAGLFGDKGSGSTTAPSSGQPSLASASAPPSATFTEPGASNANGFGSGGGGLNGGGSTIGAAGAGATSGGSDLFNASPVLSAGGTNNAGSNQTSVSAVHGRDATAMADVNSNSIIVIGPSSSQQLYADLIHRLDQRRPQVQIECTIVTLDTTNNTSFGVDIGKLGGFESSQLLTLSSFGIGTADAKTGRIAPVAATGGTFALLSPGIADVVIRALENQQQSTVSLRPAIAGE